MNGLKTIVYNTITMGLLLAVEGGEFIPELFPWMTAASLGFAIVFGNIILRVWFTDGPVPWKRQA